MAPGSSSGTEKVKASNDYIAGVAAGVATVLIGHPFDTIKVKLQTQRRNAQASQYRNGVHCLMQIVRGEGKILLSNPAQNLLFGAQPRWYITEANRASFRGPNHTPYNIVWHSSTCM